MLYDYSADSDDVELVIKTTGETLKFWTQYTYDQDFTTPTVAFSFTIADKPIVKEYYEKLAPGTLVTLVINGKAQCTGYVDSRSLKPGRDGTTLQIAGRDAISPLCDASVDPLYQFSEKTTLNDVFNKVTKPFGIYRLVSTTDVSNRSVITGNLAANTSTYYSPPTTQQGRINADAAGGATVQTVQAQRIKLGEYDPTKPRFLKNFDPNQIKPHPGEGCYEFLNRLCKRFRLGLWVSALGDELIVDEPNFKQAPIYTIARNGKFNNVLEGSLDDTTTDQPSIIVATGIGANSITPWTKLKCMMVNELTAFDSNGRMYDEVTKLIEERKKKGWQLLPLRPELRNFAGRFTSRVFKPMFYHDDESRTPGQLEGQVRHEMAQRQGKAITLKYKVFGHTQNDIPWCVNTMVMVDDNELDIHGPMWLKSRTFTKSRSGTFTDLTLIPPYTLMF